MIYDLLNTVSTNQAVTATAVTTDSVDLLQQRDIGQGEQLYLCFVVKTAPTAAGAATVTFEAIVADNGALTTNPQAIGSTAAIAIASLPVGTLVAVPLGPLPGSRGRRFFGGRYTIGTGPLTAGQFDAFLTYEYQDIAKFYPTNIIV